MYSENQNVDLSETINEKWGMIMKEGNVLFNDVVNTFYLRFYDVGHMINNWDKLLTYILVQVIGKYRDFVCVSFRAYCTNYRNFATSQCSAKCPSVIPFCAIHLWCQVNVR